MSVNECFENFPSFDQDLRLPWCSFSDWVVVTVLIRRKKNGKKKPLKHTNPIETEGLLVQLCLCCELDVCLQIRTGSKALRVLSENLKAFDGIIKVKYILNRRKVPDCILYEAVGAL